MGKDYTVTVVSPEMLIPELQEPARGANFRGGLGILVGDIAEGLAKIGVRAKVIIPFNHLNLMKGKEERVSYEDTSARFFFRLKVKATGKTVNVHQINRAGTEVFGLEHPDFNILYVADRGQRLQQEILLGHAVPALLRKLDIKPDIVWLQEGHTAITVPAIKEDPYFQGVKFLFTTHTPVPEGMEKFYEARFGELRIDEGYKSIFVKDGFIELTRAAMILADRVTAVSQEHCEVTRRMFPEFEHKIVGITNGSSRELWLSPRLKMIENIDYRKLWQAFGADKRDFVDFVQKKIGQRLDPCKPLMVWVRRIAWYKQLYPILAPVIRAICADRGKILETPFGNLEGLGIQVFSAGRAHESDSHCMGWMQEFEKWMNEPGLAGKFVFLPEYNFELLKQAIWGCDIWFGCPLPEWEACGTSDQRGAINGKINLATRAGGAKEHIVEYNPVTGGGNGFFIDPYGPVTVYNKLKIISDLYYAGDDRWPKLCLNAFESGKSLDIVPMIKGYERIFESLL